ncbi:uroporphyrinogen-III C-methyltransferase [Anaerocolumna xylanovorans]|uniref:uroporphyrinogen-III C-methyltransferase n=1 Tax=Anaerocolumna xylanovorans DSM 12503 TaxID=1121345 RepID=A0A1M7Y5T2_9FIRM|nr:uroporphyrinogen-III C-methyltransferase [Anaerocolumna xylanovorans]SHO47694.1 uroporphyrinogen III methyltransferase / synthase [Anaerocolumna xylanovorans DSM 12503]
MEKSGKVYLVGAGPGDPALLTLKGRRLLQACDAVIYDRLVSEELLDYAKEDCERIFVGKTVGNHALKQEEINQIIIEKALTHPVVVRLKGGDPFVFGRGGEEVLALKEQGISYEVVPGVTSAIAAAAYAGIPVTHRGSSQSFTVITGHTAEEEGNIPDSLTSLAQTSGTLIILMGISNLDRIAEKLLEGGKHPDTPVAVVSNGTTPWQKEVRGSLADICQKVKEAGIKAPAVIIVGSVAGLDMKATIRCPLSGVNIGITGTREIREKLIQQLHELGANTVTAGSLEIIDYSGKPEFDRALMSLEQYHWIVFTSSNAVNLFFQRLAKLGIDHRKLSHIRFAVVGSGTSKILMQYGYHADLVPQQYSAFHLAQELCNIVTAEEKLLIPRAMQGSEELITVLDDNNISYEEIKIYDVVSSYYTPEPGEKQIERLDYLVFASSSGVHGFFQDSDSSTRELLECTKIVCIGEATQRTLSEYGYANTLTAKEASVKGIVECIVENNRNDGIE